jgi:septum formation protein
MSLWKGDSPLILASGSVIRRALAESAGLPVEVIPAAIDERRLEAGLAGAEARTVAETLARAKADAVSRDHPGRYVLGADQTLSVGGRMLHKPLSRQQAADQLGLLAGRSHHLHSALALSLNGRSLWAQVETATLTARPFAGAFIHAYLDAAGDGVLTSVGAYQIEGLGMHLFEKIEGDHTIIMGLPLLPLLRQLRNLDLLHD